MKNTKVWFLNYFESSYKKGNHLSEEQYEKTTISFEQIYRNYLPKDKQSEILDVGCGTGHFLYYLKRKGYKNCLGIDVSPEQIAECHKRGLQDSLIADVFDFLKDQKKKYDLISLHDVLEHFEKDKILPLLKLINESLRLGGTLLIRVPNMSNPFSIDSRYSDMTHEAGFTCKSLYQTLWVSGFKQIDILPPKKIAVNSIRNFIRKLMVDILHRIIRFAYYIQDFTVPENLDKTITAVSIKT